jgi:hypothetical protein
MSLQKEQQPPSATAAAVADDAACHAFVQDGDMEGAEADQTVVANFPVTTSSDDIQLPFLNNELLKPPQESDDIQLPSLEVLTPPQDYNK